MANFGVPLPKIHLDKYGWKEKIPQMFFILCNKKSEETDFLKVK